MKSARRGPAPVFVDEELFRAIDGHQHRDDVCAALLSVDMQQVYLHRIWVPLQGCLECIPGVCVRIHIILLRRTAQNEAQACHLRRRQDTMHPAVERSPQKGRRVKGFEDLSIHSLSSGPKRLLGV